MLERQEGHKFPGLKVLAEHCNISVSTLKRDFKKIYGIPPLQYFRSQQVIFIKGIMNGTERTLKELTAAFGFKRTSTFTAWHKKLMGHSPLEH